MKPAELEALMKAVAPVIKSFVAETVEPLVQRIRELEEKIASMPDPRDGKDGTSVTVEDVAPLIEQQVRKTVAEAVAALPEPKDGKDGKDGKDADPELIRSMVAEAVAALPKPKDGKDGRDGKDGKDGKDGAGVAGAVINRDGELVLTLSDGRTVNLGRVVGKDGKPGEPGKDGADGLGFEDMEEVLADEGRTIVRRYRRGDKVKEFRHSVPALIYREVWREGVVYSRGDCVTWAGSLWHCNKDTQSKPGESDAWTLAVKRGRHGRDGEPGKSITPNDVKPLIDDAVKRKLVEVPFALMSPEPLGGS